MSRAMIAVVLHNLEYNPNSDPTDAFADVPNSQWFAQGIAWASARGIVGGYGNGSFGPNDPLTNEQLAVILWRYAGSPAATDNELHFSSLNKASKWAVDALRWAKENGLLNTPDGSTFNPSAHATRAETALMLKNFLENS